MERKTSINNLNIVWQGQSWSVIAPDGDVVGRFKDKQDAIRFAQITKDYLKKQIVDFQTYKPKVSMFDGELLSEREDVNWPKDNIVFEKPKNAPQSIIQRIKENRRRFIVSMTLVVVIILILLFLELAHLVSNIFSAPDIFMAPDTISLLGIAAIVFPVLWIGLKNRHSEIIRRFVGWPFMLVGLLGLFVGIFIGAVYLIVRSHFKIGGSS